MKHFRKLEEYEELPRWGIFWHYNSDALWCIAVVIIAVGRFVGQLKIAERS